MYVCSIFEGSCYMTCNDDAADRCMVGIYVWTLYVDFVENLLLINFKSTMSQLKSKRLNTEIFFGPTDDFSG